MQYSLACTPCARLKEIDRLITARHSPLPSYERLDPVSQLILSLIGARTEGQVSRRVFLDLRQRFWNWSALTHLSGSALTRLLQPVNYAERKAGQLAEALRIVRGGAARCAWTSSRAGRSRTRKPGSEGSRASDRR